MNVLPQKCSIKTEQKLLTLTSNIWLRISSENAKVDVKGKLSQVFDNIYLILSLKARRVRNGQLTLGSGR